MNLYQETIDSKQIFSGRILDLRVDTVKLPDGNTAYREIVDHKAAVAVLPIVDGCVIFVRQFRKAIDRVMLELPAGLIEKGEDSINTATRELQEEIGLKPLDLHLLGVIYSSPGFTNEAVIMYLATEFEESALAQDADEFIQTVKIPIETVRMLYHRGKFTDAHTACALGYYFSQG